MMLTVEKYLCYLLKEGGDEEYSGGPFTEMTANERTVLKQPKAFFSVSVLGFSYFLLFSFLFPQGM